MKAGLALRGWAAVLGIALAGLAPAATAAPVAMVTDVEGKATLASRALVITAEIEQDARVQLEAGARVVAVYLDSADEFELKGPALVQFRAAQPEAVSGAKPVKRGSALAKGGKELRIKPVGLAQAALVMRSAKPGGKLRLQNLAGTKTLDKRPEFRWEGPQGGLKYQFELTDDAGKVVHEAQVDGTALQLPAQLQLRAGVQYTWEVSAKLPDGKKYSNTGDFSVADAALAQQAELLRPGPGAPLSGRVAYAAWLEQVELKDEARKHWKAIAAERRDDPRLRELAGQ